MGSSRAFRGADQIIIDVHSQKRSQELNPFATVSLRIHGKSLDWETLHKLLAYTSARIKKGLSYFNFRLY